MVTLQLDSTTRVVTPTTSFLHWTEVPQPGVNTSYVIDLIYRTSGHPAKITGPDTLDTLLERAKTTVPDGLLQSLLDAPRTGAFWEVKATDGVNRILRGRVVCLKLFDRQDKPEGALAARYDELHCPEQKLPHFVPKKFPCYSRGHAQCELFWSRKQVKKRQKKLVKYAEERGGASLLKLDWPCTDRDSMTKAWKSLRRSKKRPKILSPAMFFPEELETGRRIWVLLPRVTDQELEEIRSLWDEIVQRYTGQIGQVAVVA